MIARLSWPTAVALGATALAIIAMFFDHMLDVEEPFPADWPAFVISVGIVLVTSAIVFGALVRRTRAGPDCADVAAKRGLACSIASVLSLPAIWLGLPFVIAGGGITLGVLGRTGRRRRMALAAIAIGALVVILALVGTDWSSDR